MSDAFKAISAAKATIDSLRLLAQYGDEIKDIQKYGEFMRIIGETNLQLVETQNRLAEQIRQNSDLREEIAQLKKEIKVLKDEDAKPILKDGFYYAKEDGPFCTGCYDVNKELVRVAKVPELKRIAGDYRCPRCKTYF